jgi:hypothetical protein
MTATGFQPSGIDQWVDFIRYSLADILVRGEWDDFGIFRILNRMTFLSRDHIIFILHHEEDQRFIIDTEISAFDPWYRSSLVKAIINLGFVTSVPELNRAKGRQNTSKMAPNHKSQEYRLRMFDTKNYLLVFTVHETRRPAGEVPELSFEPVSRDSLLGQYFVRVLAPFDGQEGRMKIDEPIEPRLAKLRGAGLYRKALDMPPENLPLTNYDRADLNTYSTYLYGMVDAEYRRLKLSPLLRGYKELSGVRPTNVFFFSKSFVRDSTRFGHYLYDPLFLTGPAQSKDLRAAVEAMDRDDFIPYPVRIHDDRFWKVQKSTGGADEILRTARSGPHKEVRVFTENVLMSGSTTIEADVFERGGIGWIDARGLTHSDLRERYQYLVALHYLMQLGAPRRPVDCQNLSIVSLPFRCSGAIWMAACFIRENTAGTIPSLIDQRQFERSYLIYHSLLRESERRFRRKAREAYLSTIAFTAADESYGAARPKRGTAKRRRIVPSITAEEAQLFNHRSSLISRLFPFPWATIDVADGLTDHPELTTLDVVLRENPFFDRLQLREFIDKGTIKGKILSQILAQDTRRAR